MAVLGLGEQWSSTHRVSCTTIAGGGGDSSISGGVIAQAVRDDDGFGWVLTVADDCANRRPSYTRSKSGGVILTGRGCTFRFGDKTLTLDVHWQTIPVPGNGSCMIAAVARTLARLDLPLLKQQPGLQNVKWGPFDEWASLGKDLLRSVDTGCARLRERIGRLLWTNADKCSKYFERGPTIEDRGDIAPANYRRALQTARKICLLGEDASVDPEKDFVKGWAVAILDQRTHCTDAVMRAVLAADFEDAMGILVATRVARDDSASRKRNYVHMIQDQQDLVPVDALFVIGIHHHSAIQFISDEQIKMLVETKLEEKKLGSRSSSNGRKRKGTEALDVKSDGKRPRPSDNASTNPPAEGKMPSNAEPSLLDEEDPELAEKEKLRKEVTSQQYAKVHNVSHFDEAVIKGGIGGADRQIALLKTQ